MVSAAQTVLPESEGGAEGQLNASGLVFRPSFELPAMVRDNIEQCLAEGVGKHVAHGGWNDLFWAVHPGGRAILDNIEGKLQLQPWKLAASRQVLHDYGNMSGATIAFVLDELRRRREKEEHELQQHEWGVMLAFGPGITIEAIVMRNPQLSGLKEN